MGSRTGNSTPPRPRAAGKHQTPQHAASVAALLERLYPDAHVELDHKTAYELVVATILSAQSTDKMINTLTPGLFAKYPNAAALAAADQAEVEPLIFKSGFFRAKAKSIIGMAKKVVEKHGGEIPSTMAELVDLPGIARKTANVVLGSVFGQNVGVVVDTHVNRVCTRLGLTSEEDPVKIEADLMGVLPQAQWTDFAHRVIWHGRRVCFAKQPDCDHCTLAPICPSATPLASAGKGSGTNATPKPGKRGKVSA